MCDGQDTGARRGPQRRGAIAPVREPTARSGFTILELLTVVAIIGVLLSLALPAIGAAREAARKLQCVNHLKQVGLALHNYHESCGRLPAAWQWEQTQRFAYAWPVPLLPYLEQQPLSQKVDRNQPLNAPVNSLSRQTSVSVLLCPSDIYDSTFMLFRDDDGDDEGESPLAPAVPLFELPTASYVAVFGTIEPDEDPPRPVGDGPFPGTRPVRFAELSRGLSNTILVGERTMARVPSTWLGVDVRGDDANCRIAGAAITAPNCDTCDECEFDSRHAGGANFLWGDGRVQLISENIDAEAYRTMSLRQLPTVWTTAALRH